MLKMLSVLGVVGLALAGGPYVAAKEPAGRAADPKQQSAAPVSRTAATQTTTPPSRALLDQYCITCHNDKLKTAGLTLEKIDLGDAKAHAEVLEKVVRKLRSGQMPPDGRPRPDQANADTLAASLETELDRVAALAPNPGRVASHRLNRAEYVNVIRDLLALEVNGAELLPSDMAGFGFDNNADVLAVTPGLMARYMSAATKISRLAMASPDNRPMMQVYKLDVGTRQNARMNENMPFATHGGLAVRHTFPLDGDYLFKMRMVRNGTVGTIEGIDEDQSKIELRVDHQLLKRFDIGGQLKGPDPGVLIAVPEDDIDGQKVHDYRLNADNILELRLPIKAGTRLVAAGFTDSMPSPIDDGPSQITRLLGGNAVGIDMLYISGPFNGRTTDGTPSRQQIFVCRPASARDEDACARRMLTTLARRAYRRPVVENDVTPLMALYKEGRAKRDFDGGIERALEALLSSPKFLIRLEREPADVKPGAPYRLSDLELASRLSFFLWRSIPDDELLDLAAAGKLKDPSALTQQVKRMIADKRATRFMDDFAGQWLQVRNIQAQAPDVALFPDFDDTLRDAMAEETELFFQSQVREDHPIPDLLRSNYTFLNERLARHYGIDNIYGSHFRRVTLSDDRRMGLLGQASILTVSSYSNRTSVVLRGKWVLENILGAPPPPPPPNVPPLKENDGKSKPTALRERMEAHRRNPVCAACHGRMDPLGFALEHYDAVGKWRETDTGAEINSTISWFGNTIDSPKAFREALLNRGNEFNKNVVEKLLTYALGRGVDFSDAPTVRKIVTDISKNDYRWSSLVLGIVKSAPFQMRRAMTPERAATPTSVAGR